MTSHPVEAADYNTRIIKEFRANQGRVGGPWAGYTVILIHHIGARSMIERVTPLSCFPQRDGRWAIVASDGGAQGHPGWYHNLKANPKIRVELGGETFVAIAEEQLGSAHAEIWPKLVAKVPRLAELQSSVARRIPVFILTRQS